MTAEQLPLPQLDPYLKDPSVYTLPRQRRIWVNRSLRLDQIEWVGFDMDYTLAIYKQPEIDKLSIEATVKKLLERGYPPELAEVKYASDFPVRGLFIDKRYGHILKMDRYKYVGKAFHGMRELSREERRTLYHSRKVRPAAPRYHWIDTLYALPEAALYAGAVDLLDRYGTPVDYAQLFQDIRECIDEAHRDGAIVDVIEHNLPRFVDRDRDLAAALHKLRSAGKKLFLLTNSRWKYTQSMMSYLLDGQTAEYPSWRQYFDVVVTAATKPAFFQERRPFMERVGDESVPASALERGRIYEGGNLRDFERMIKSGGDAILYVGDHIYGDILRSKKESAWRTAMIVQEMEGESAAMELTRGDIAHLESLANRRDRLEDELRFRQGRLKEVVRALEERGVHVASGANGEVHADGSDADAREVDSDATDRYDRVACGDPAPHEADGDPDGDHHDGLDAADAADGKRADDGAVTQTPPLATPAQRAAEARAAALAASVESTAVLEAERLREKRAIERIRGALRELEDESRALSRRVDQTFHPYWGSIFKLGVELSSFGDQVENYACLYTSRVSNFFAYSPLHFFRSPRDFMPHELP